ncbi:hypothetical protein CAEBREN_06184 [Caenorhabditis brenneri]|uniref:Uncharacterized protein n=1 Tax=Caenorhabditis brenneri TaxID=135651 RepID=G0PCZ1_CAEBE|nr:hypothetical protein CAEBREN_06184 [Caenorhabditis brenneri]
MLKVVEFILGFKLLSPRSFRTLARKWSVCSSTSNNAGAPRLYQYIRMNEGSFITINKEYKEYMRTTGQVFTWATSPNAEEIAHMTEEIWSLRLGYLKDPDQQFKPKLSFYSILCFTWCQVKMTHCVNHFASKSAITLKDQFKLADYCNSKNLMVQVCSAIRNPSELYEVVQTCLGKCSPAIFRAPRIQETA